MLTYIDDINYQIMVKVKGKDLLNLYNTDKYAKNIIDKLKLSFWQEKFKDLIIIDYHIENLLYLKNYVAIGNNFNRHINWLTEYVRTYEANEFAHKYLNLIDNNVITFILNTNQNLNHLGDNINKIVKNTKSTHIFISFEKQPDSSIIFIVNFGKQYFWFTYYYIKTYNELINVIDDIKIKQLLLIIGYYYNIDEITNLNNLY